MTHSTQISPLLRLPPELRNGIYSYVLCEHQKSPPNPSFAGERVWHNDIAYPKYYSSWRYPSLVWVNRQLRNEYMDLVEELSNQGRLKAELDIMSKGYVFYPTWVYLPPDWEMPIDLTVNLRIFSTEAYRSNDGWPRQPGSGFRCLLRLLYQLVHYGPSFGKHLELLRGRFLFAIKKLSVRISFHDDYTPDTWPETAHNIFKMSKALAIDGLANDIVSRVHVHTEYAQRGAMKVFEGYWEVSSHWDKVKAREWRRMGFLWPGQKCLSDEEQVDVKDDFI